MNEVLITTMTVFQENEELDTSALAPLFLSVHLRPYNLQSRVYTYVCSGQNNCSGQGSDECSGQNRSTGAVFRANRGAKPTSIERVTPVGQGSEQPTRFRLVYQHLDSGCTMSEWTHITRSIDDI